MKKIIFILTCGFFAAPLSAMSIQDWLKKGGGYQRPRKVTSQHTTVAAVRGVDEPGDVDPKARNFEAVSEMEKRMIPKEILSKFIEEGGLKKK